MACQTPVIMLFFHCRLVVLPWIPWIFCRSFLGSRFSSSFCSLDLVSRRLGPWISIPNVIWNLPGATYPRRPGADPAPNYSARRRLDPFRGWHTLFDMSLKIALVFNLFFFVFRLIFGSKMPPKIDPKTFKNHFQNRSRF